MLAALGPDGIPVAPVSALLFLALGLSLAATMRDPESHAGERFALFTATLSLAVSLLVAAQWRIGFALPWDGWLQGEGLSAAAPDAGRMSPLTVIAFLLLSVGYLAHLIPHRSRAPWLWIGLMGAAPGLVIGLEVLATHATGTPRQYGGEIVPMAVLSALAFAALGLGLLLLSAVRGILHEWLTPETAEDGRPYYRREALAITVIALLVAFAGLFYLSRGRVKFPEAIQRELETIANLKSEQLAAWRNERLAEARFLMNTQAVVRDLAAFVAHPESARRRERVIEWLEPLRGDTRYQSTLVFDAGGRLLLSVPPTAAQGSPAPADAFAKALGSRDAVVADLYRAVGESAIHLDFLAPIWNPRGAAKGSTAPSGPVAVVVLRVDPKTALYPLIQRWPVPSDTAETLLVRREGREAVFLNELRHQTGAALTLRRSLDDPTLPAAVGLRGDEKVNEGSDYRGVAVIATSRAIPGSPWVLVAKIDQLEAYRPIRREALQDGVQLGLAMLALALGGGFLSRLRRAAVLRRALEAEHERSILTERLALITRHANDIIFLLDGHGRILEANDRAIAAYGYTLDELRSLPAGGLRPAGTSADATRDLSLIDRDDGALFETLHRRKDGSAFPVEVSGRAVTIGGGRYLLGVMRDIAERKKHQAEVERLNRLYAARSQVNQAIVHATTREGLLEEICRGLVEAGGFPMVWIGWPDPASGLVRPASSFGDALDYLDGISVTRHDAPNGRGPVGTSIRENKTVVCNDFLGDPTTQPWHEAARRSGFRAVISLPIRRDGAALGAVAVYATQTDFFGAREIELLEEAALDLAFGLTSLDREEQRARAEAALAKSEERLRLALAAGHQGLYDLNVQTGDAATSPEYASMLGYDPISFRETNALWIERLHPDDREPVAQAYEGYIAGRRTEYRVEFRQRAATGEWKWILSLGRIVERDSGGQPLRMLGTHTDITDLKRAEAAVAASEVRYRRLFESSKDGILILDAESGMVVDVNPFIVELLGFSREAFMGKAIWDLGFFRDIVANRDSFAELQAQEYIRYEDKPLETASGQKIDVEFVSNVYLVDERKVIQCNIRDITERRRADDALRASLREKEALLKEVHHRVKNNLQVITSLLRLETSRNSDPNTKIVLKEMQGRIRSMALLHETLYRSGNFARVDLADYLLQLSSQLFRTQNAEPSRVRLVNDLESSRVNIDQAIPCGLITNELLTNALKYAFLDGRAGEVRLELRTASSGEIRLTVSDTGIGLPADFEERRGRSLGLQLVADLTRQLAGGLQIDPGPGAKFCLSFIPHVQ